MLNQVWRVEYKAPGDGDWMEWCSVYYFATAESYIRHLGPWYDVRIICDHLE